MFGLSVGMVVVTGQNPVPGLVLVHLPVFVFVSKFGKLFPLGLHPLGFRGISLLVVHVT